MFRLLPFIALFLLVTCETKAESATDSFPASMLEFLKKGMQVRLGNDINRDGDTEPYFTVRILDESSYQIAIDERELSLTELRGKYPSIEANARKTLSSFRVGLQERSKKLAPGKRYAPPEIFKSERRGMLCTVVSVGDNYVLFSCGVERLKRIVPLHMIKKIDWGEGLPQLYARASIVDDGSEKIKQ